MVYSLRKTVVFIVIELHLSEGISQSQIAQLVEKSINNFFKNP